MIGGFRSELIKLRRLSMLCGPIAMVGITALAVFFGITRIHDRPDALLYIATLQQANGLVIFLSHGADLLLLIAVLLVAGAVGEEWTRGTLRTMLVFDSTRLRFLLGKCLALLVYIVIGCVLSTALGTGIAFLVAPGVNIVTSAWSTSAGIHAFIQYLGNFSLCLFAWCTFGVFLGVIFRSAAAAIGIALGYLFVIDILVDLLLPGVGKWLFGQMTQSVLGGGSGTIPYHTALIGTCCYIAVMIIATALTFRFRDVTA